MQRLQRGGGAAAPPALRLSNCGVRDVHLPPLIEALRGACGVERLDLSFNHLTDAGVQHLVSAMCEEGALRRLETLLLWENSVGRAGLCSLASALEQCALPSLRSLSYSRKADDAAKPDTAELAAVCKTRGIRLCLRP